MTRYQLNQALTKNENINEKWKSFISFYGLNEETDLQQLSYKCAVSIDKARGWLNEPPKKKKDFCTLGLSLGMSLEETQEMIRTFSNHQPIYVKNLEDAVFFYMFNTGYGINTPHHSFENLKNTVANANLPNVFFENKNISSTIEVQKDLSKQKDLSAFVDFVINHQDAFEQGNRKVFDYFEERIVKYNLKTCQINQTDVLGITYKAFMRSIKEAKKEHKIIGRISMIKYCIALYMTEDEINSVLNLSHYHPLSSTITGEAILMFALENLEETYPQIFLKNISKDAVKKNNYFDKLADNIGEVDLITDDENSDKFIDMLALVKLYIIDLFPNDGIKMCEILEKYLKS